MSVTIYKVWPVATPGTVLRVRRGGVVYTRFDAALGVYYAEEHSAGRKRARTGPLAIFRARTEERFLQPTLRNRAYTLKMVKGWECISEEERLEMGAIAQLEWQIKNKITPGTSSEERSP